MIIVVAPFVLPQDNWSFDSDKTNGVRPPHVSNYVTKKLSLTIEGGKLECNQHYNNHSTKGDSNENIQSGT